MYLKCMQMISLARTGKTFFFCLLWIRGTTERYYNYTTTILYVHHVLRTKVDTNFIELYPCNMQVKCK